jgi:ABC-type transporter Mla maintaining outer membrane lipid asymmetry ATPase subunit MlaF
MPRFNHVIETEYQPTFRTEKVVGMFDVPMTGRLVKSWDVDLPIEGLNWNVGLIVGASGAGKTTIAKRAFDDAVFFESHEWGKSSFLNDFQSTLDIKTITDSLSHVGFASPPAWLLPYHCLSNGQKFRADLARAILETDGILVFDEFTSLVDRTVAKVGSYAVQKYVRKMKRQFVAVTCHYDVAEWLEPDWVYDVSTMEFSRRSLWRPSIEVQIQQVHHSVWQVFKGHHYLSAELNKAALVYVATIEGQPAAMTAILPFPHPHVKNVWREHRTVVLPDFQGIGLGNRLAEHVGDILLAKGKRFTSVTSHPAMIHSRAKSLKWKMTRGPGRVSAPSVHSKITNVKNTSVNRLTASFEYFGEIKTKAQP